MKHLRELRRYWLAVSVIVAGFVGIVAISGLYGGLVENSWEKIFSTVIPLFATWIGTILAFYFGKENFEAATESYQQIINKLSPEILDDVLVTQAMIWKKTIVFAEKATIDDQKVSEVKSFLQQVKKSRLPVLDQGKVSYVIHESTLMAESQPDTKTMKDFFKSNEGKLQSFLIASESDTLERVRKELASSPGIQDVFVNDSNDQMIGWLTNTKISQFLNQKL